MSLIKKDEQIAKDLEFRILSGNENFANIISSERNLSDEYQTSRNTIRKALYILINKGIITLNDKNYILNDPKIDYDTLEANDIEPNEYLNNKVLKVSRLEADKTLSREIQQPLGTKLKKIIYIRYEEDGHPYSVDEVLIPENALTDDIWRLNNASALKEISKKYNHPFVKELQKISIVKASSEIATQLEIPTAQSILVRDSLFISENSDFFLHLVSNKVVESALITQRNNELKTKEMSFNE
ncbi:GntR family transcriptional regulator [Lactobacillus sp. YT155]|uniref:UTRA domain-containing protein n=1 Tax=Lactobacillus sp. YT155 TaxID=3060955 RepID=UPI00265E6C42|nr:GntR family transcriptional regulator [Lactobacillus sp. YT155]MDO1605632.1 GntR family transcriptional regulator [Lactobacillus sp. YT155]